MARVAGMTAFAQYRLATNADHRQDRAYVLAEGVSIELNANSAAPRVVASVKNRGKTPALKVSVTSRCRVMRTPPAPFGELPKPKYSLGQILATDGATTFSATCDEQLTEQDTIGLKARKIAIYFDAQILYRNVFDLDHRTFSAASFAEVRSEGTKMANSNLADEGEEAD
jgi:hypothetical protein